MKNKLPLKSLAVPTCVTWAVLALLHPTATLADDAPATLQQVVVSGSRSEQARDDLPMTIDVLMRMDMDERLMTDIKDLAKDLPNVSVRHAPSRFSVTGVANPVGRDDNAGFSVRGMGGNRVLMLIDSVRMPRSYVNGSNAFGRDAMALNLVKQVEVVRGPTSVLYGSDGVAGMVNFLTYEPIDLLRAKGTNADLAGRFSAQWNGDREGAGIAATVAGRVSDSMQWLLSAGVEKSGAMDNMGTNEAPNATRTRPNPETSRKESLLAKVVLRPDARQKHTLALEHVGKSMQTELLSSRASVLPAPTTTATRALVAGESAGSTSRRDRWSWEGRFVMSSTLADQVQTMLVVQQADASQDGQTRRNDGGLRLRDTAYNERTVQANLQASKSLAMGEQWSQRLTYGIDSTQVQVSSWFDGFDPVPLPKYVPKKYFPDAKDSGLALYVQSQMQNDTVSITPGIRFERYAVDVVSQDGFAPPSATPGVSVAGYHTSPKLGALWRLAPQRSLFVNYATGFRAPSASQLNGAIDPTPTFNARLLPNPDLKPETSRHWEIGYRAKTALGQWELAAFTGDYSQLIVDKKFLRGTNTVADPNVFQTVNIDNASIWGLEFKGSVDAGSVAGGQLSLPFALGWARGKDNTSGLPLNTVDPASLSLGLQFEAPTWSMRADLRHNTAKNAADVDPTGGVRAGSTQFTGVPAVTTLDLGGQVRLRKDIRLTANLVNLTNAKYWLWSDVQGLSTANAVTQADAYTQPGRHLNVSLIVDF